MNDRLSLLIVAHNEEALLAEAILAGRVYANEVVVVVQQSNDLTLKIACELADTVLEQPKMGGCEFSRKAGIEACQGAWVLQLDADERLTDYGQSQLRTLLRAPNTAYALRRVTTVDGQLIEDAYHLRLLRPDQWDGDYLTVHRALGVNHTIEVGTVGALPVIDHHKSGTRQAEADERYRRYGYTRSEARPEWANIAWTVRHK
jgi:glycosyltransferase involved in cell wall biosynthesis